MLLASTADFGQSRVTEDPEATLQQIRTKVAEQLSRLPNYTCHEGIDRLVQWLNGSGRMDQDRVDLEVAFVGKRELFARPGESQFQEQDLRKLVPTGTIGDGFFATVPKLLFLDNGVVFHYTGVVNKDHHKTDRYDFKVPEEKSGFLVRHDSAQSIVGFQGSIWADVDTHDLVRIEFKADHIPARVNLRHVAEKIRYGVVRIRDSDVLLAGHAEIETYDSDGIHTLDAVKLENCREFSAESSVQFGKPLDSETKDRRDPDR
jgi:hypothetical protein